MFIDPDSVFCDHDLRNYSLSELIKLGKKGIGNHLGWALQFVLDGLQHLWFGLGFRAKFFGRSWIREQSRGKLKLVILQRLCAHVFHFFGKAQSGVKPAAARVIIDQIASPKFKSTT
jgi:hypothetical protein